MCNKEQLIGFLYGELHGADRGAFEAHLAGCAGCQEEVQGLRQTRVDLASWAPPEPDLEIRVVRGERQPPRSRTFVPPVPAWAYAAAASILLLAGAAALANLELRYGQLVIRTGWGGHAPEHAAAAAVFPQQAEATSEASDRSSEVAANLRAIEMRLRELEASAVRPAAAPVAARTSLSDEQLALVMAAVRKQLAESEARHRTEMALHIAQVWQDFNATRASDVARFEQTIGRALGMTNYELRRQQHSIESLVRTSLQK